MKILFLNSVYGEKSTGNIVKSLALHCIEQGHKVICVYGRGNKSPDEWARKTQGKLSLLFNAFISRISGRFWSRGSSRSTKRIEKIIRKFRPDIVNIHQIYGYYLNPKEILSFLSKLSVPTVITLHDFTLFTGKCGYPVKCTKFISSCGECPRKKNYLATLFFDRTASEQKLKKSFFADKQFTFVAVSEWLKREAQRSSVLANKDVRCINNGVNPSIFCYKEPSKKNPGQVLVVCTNFGDEIKGGDFLIKTINEVRRLNTNVSFLLVGKNASFIMAGVEDKAGVTEKESVAPEEIALFYRSASLTFVPSVSETFSLPTVESLCCGTPAVGPVGCGAPEFLLDDPFCDFRTPRDPEKMAQRIVSFAFASHVNSASLSRKALNKFSCEKMLVAYLKLFQDLTANGKAQ